MTKKNDRYMAWITVEHRYSNGAHALPRKTLVFVTSGSGLRDTLAEQGRLALAAAANDTGIRPIAAVIDARPARLGYAGRRVRFTVRPQSQALAQAVLTSRDIFHEAVRAKPSPVGRLILERAQFYLDNPRKFTTAGRTTEGFDPQKDKEY